MAKGKKLRRNPPCDADEDRPEAANTDLPKTVNGILAKIEIIGEAMTRIVKVYPDIKISHTRKIVDTRNRIIHGYDSISAEILWGIIINNLPDLEKEIQQLI